MITLTNEERTRFASWLEYEAQTDKELMIQMEKLGPAMKMIIDYRKEAA